MTNKVPKYLVSDYSVNDENNAYYGSKVRAKMYLEI